MDASNVPLPPDELPPYVRLIQDQQKQISSHLSKTMEEILCHLYSLTMTPAPQLTEMELGWTSP